MGGGGGERAPRRALRGGLAVGSAMGPAPSQTGKYNRGNPGCLDSSRNANRPLRTADTKGRRRKTAPRACSAPSGYENDSCLFFLPFLSSLFALLICFSLPASLFSLISEGLAASFKSLACNPAVPRAAGLGRPPPPPSPSGTPEPGGGVALGCPIQGRETPGAGQRRGAGTWRRRQQAPNWGWGPAALLKEPGHLGVPPPRPGTAQDKHVCLSGVRSGRVPAPLSLPNPAPISLASPPSPPGHRARSRQR